MVEIDFAITELVQFGVFSFLYKISTAIEPGSQHFDVDTKINYIVI